MKSHNIFNIKGLYLDTHLSGLFSFANWDTSSLHNISCWIAVALCDKVVTYIGLSWTQTICRVVKRNSCLFGKMDQQLHLTYRRLIIFIVILQVVIVWHSTLVSLSFIFFTLSLFEGTILFHLPPLHVRSLKKLFKIRLPAQLDNDDWWRQQWTRRQRRCIKLTRWSLLGGATARRSHFSRLKRKITHPRCATYFCR